jgi:hypothetical protein
MAITRASEARDRCWRVSDGSGVGFIGVLGLLKAPLELPDQSVTALAFGTIFQFSNTVFQIMSITHSLPIRFLP